ncbi:DUF2249 domain-containing protein [Aestuariimicrobium ganziense]|uniref:DUF2249 domain-containing protein n=1 Tax=Aestuariimicrobium ganziense TaxID=2773677 RepID=UPI001944C20A|nr:DUF2249 domain-containing protein [Aestuariimicrobium ganziense]
MTELPLTDKPLTDKPLAEKQSCGCGGHDHDLPEIDARAIPHRIRHGAILGALGSLHPGEAMVLVAPHDPKPLLAQIGQLHGDAVEASYLEQGPEAWRIKLTRR